MDLSHLNLKSEYQTGESDPVAGFYRPCLLNSLEYKRAVGYFRSSVYLVVGEPSVEFARRGGRIRLVCSPSMLPEDVSAIESGYAARQDWLEHSLIADIDSLLSEPSTSYRTRVLASLVAAGTMEIRIAIRPNANGLYHEKIGIFSDGAGGRVSFLGSANETWQAWHSLGNHERLEVFRSWCGESDAERVARHDAYFERLWAGSIAGLEVVRFPDASRRKLVEASIGDLNAIEFDIADCNQTPSRKPMPHQVAAMKSWHEAGQRGIFEHATGSGKTFTALCLIREHLSFGLPCIVLVPSDLLLKQWFDEIREEIPSATIMRAGAGHTSWRTPGRLQSMTGPSSTLGPRIVLATIQTAATNDFYQSVQSGPHLMMVVDEVHESGSAHNSNVFLIDAGARLGLSATPTRFGDPEGTGRILSYFGTVLSPRVTLKDAIQSGRLVDYEYYPHPMNLTDSEAAEWGKLTLQIVREMPADSDKSKAVDLSDRVKMLLIKRSRIAKKAVNKVEMATEIVAESFVDGERWLIYCEDTEQLQCLMRSLNKAGLRPVEYHSSMAGDKGATIEWFKKFGGLLVSIRCLDEGVDIPSIDHALILASSQNPRQFIQRRGRVLRRSEGKNLAVIHDVIVVPLSLDAEPDQIGLLRSEFARAIEFADSAINAGAAAELRSIAINLGLDPEEMAGVGLEEVED